MPKSEPGARGRGKPPGKIARDAGGAAAGKRTVGSIRKAPPARAKVEQLLAGSVVLDGMASAGITGAQAVAPDHSPRGAVTAHTVRPAALVAVDLQREVEQFLFRQSELLDAKLWADWIDLFTPDGVYWMPVTPEQTEWEDSPSIFAEDKLMMEIRMGRVSHPNAWSQAPLWATNHLVGNIVIESADASSVNVRSRFQMMELRRDEIRHFGGTYRHQLLRTKTGLRIELQRVDLFNSRAPFDYVLQIWV